MINKSIRQKTNEKRKLIKKMKEMEETKKIEQKNTIKGITLIALVVTIIVLLILAGVSITNIFGDNGIIEQANEAREKTNEGEEKEKIELATTRAIANSENGIERELLIKELDNNNLEDYTLEGNEEPYNLKVNGREYEISSDGVIYWTEALANPKMHPNQENSEDIGIGTDGKPVNLDLWHYEKTSDGNGMCLGPSGHYDHERDTGYLGDIVNGAIQGRMPQYIYLNNEKKIYPVVFLNGTFAYMEELAYAPTIPSTVTDMSFTFFCCTNLKKVVVLPRNYEHYDQVFKNCQNLNIEFADGVTRIDKGFEWGYFVVKSIYFPSSITEVSSRFIEANQVNRVENVKFVFGATKKPDGWNIDKIPESNFIFGKTREQYEREYIK